MHEDIEDLISKVALNKNELFTMSHEISGIQQLMAATGYETGDLFIYILVTIYVRQVFIKEFYIQIFKKMQPQRPRGPS